jgi:hypothetical protein
MDEWYDWAVREFARKIRDEKESFLDSKKAK